MASVTTSQNINAVTYAAGEAIAVGNAMNALVRLTIDAQNSADVAKIEGTLIGSLSLTGNAEIYVVNTSTTTPLVIKFANQTSKRFDTGGPSTKFKTRGAWISIGTGTGAYDQTISTIIGGKRIDWPPFVEVETAAGSGVYAQMLNIQGDYQNDNSVVPTYKHTFSECGTTKEVGWFFEYDELNSTIHFASAAGGWVPPSGANIRIPNIHFTAVGVPSSLVAYFSGRGNLDMEYTTFSNRMGGRFGYHGGVRLVSCSIPANNAFASIDDALYIRNCVINYNCYAQGASTIAGSEQGHDVDGLRAAMHNMDSLLHRLGKSALVKNISVGSFSKTSSYAGALEVTQTSGLDGSYKRVENTFVAGAMFINNLDNVVFKGVYLSNDMTSAANTSNRQFGIRSNGPVKNSTIQTIRKANGGGVVGQAPIGFYENAPVRNVAVHDLVYDGLSTTYYAMYFGAAERVWFANSTMDNPASAPMTTNSTGPYKPFSRAQNVKGTWANAPAQSAGSFYSMCSNNAATTKQGGGSLIRDLPNVSVNYSSGTTGVLSFVLQTLPGSAPNFVANAGVRGTDYDFSTYYFYAMTTTADLTFTGSHPARGITSMAGVAVSTIPTGWVVKFRIRPYGSEQAWPAWSSHTGANWTAAFNAMTGYNSNDGFEVQMNITVSSNNANAADSLAVTGMTVDTGFAPWDVGFVDFVVSGGQDQARIAIIDTTSSPVLRALATLGATGGATIDCPHHFSDGAKWPFKLVARKVGYQEYTSTGQIGQDGYSTPVPQIAGWPATNSSVAGIALDGTAKTIVVTGSKTFQEVYQHSQWWSVQRTNFVYDIPMTSADGSTFSVPTTWKITWAMPSDKTLSGGWLLLSTPGTLNYKLSGTKIEFQTAGNYDMGGTAFSGTVEFVNTSGGAVTVSIPSGFTPVNTGPSITLSAPVISTTVAAQVSLAGAEIRVYDLDNSPAGSLGTELAGTESCPGSTFSFTVASGNSVWVQIMLAGYKEYGQQLTGPSASTSFTFALIRETDA